MKTVFLTTDSSGAKYIANVLFLNGFLNAIIIEKSKQKIKVKLQRELKKSPWWKLPIKIVDFFSVFLYSKVYTCYLTKHLLLPNQFTHFPKGVSLYGVENASCPESISILTSLSPDVIIVLGTSILKPQVLAIPKKIILNIHGGIVPEYRNVHSDFWAFYKGDFKNLGTSIIHLDPGIDTGDIAIQSSIKTSKNETILTVKKKNLELAGKMIIEALNKASKGLLSKTPQNHSQKGFYKTPGLLDFICLLFKTIGRNWFYNKNKR